MSRSSLRQALPDNALCLSARSGEGLQALRQALLRQAGWRAVPEGGFLARARHVQARQAAQAHLAQAADGLAQPQPALELLAEELRLAHDALGDITGHLTADDLLGEIFGRFCIGK